MPYAFFKIPCGPEPGAAQMLNDFLRGHTVLNVQKEWVSAGEASFWSFCIQYQEAGTGAPFGRGGAPAGKVD